MKKYTLKPCSQCGGSAKIARKRDHVCCTCLNTEYEGRRKEQCIRSGCEGTRVAQGYCRPCYDGWRNRVNYDNDIMRAIGSLNRQTLEEGWVGQFEAEKDGLYIKIRQFRVDGQLRRLVSIK